MTRVPFLVAAAAALAAAGDAASIGPRGGGGGARPAPQPATPSLSRPAAAPIFGGRPGFVPQAGGVNLQRPGGFNPGFQRPNVGAVNLPNVTRPAGGGLVPRPNVNVGNLNRPNVNLGNVNRPNVNVGNRPNVGNTINNRPNIGNTNNVWNRPNIGNTVINNRPNVGNAINSGNTTNILNRPNVNIGNRVTSNTINVNRWNQYNTAIGVRPGWAKPAYWNRPWYGNRPVSTWGRPWYWQHSNWHHGYWTGWPRTPAFWYGSGAAAGWLASPGSTIVYSNQYYVAPPQTTVVYNYAQPLPVPVQAQAAEAYPPAPTGALTADFEPQATAALPPPPPTTDPAVAAADRDFDAARAAFRAGDYGGAQRSAESAIRQVPSDATLHEFRALRLFAQYDYQGAAASLYAVLAAGPGWDWETMSSLYPNGESYTQQLRALENRVRAAPTEGESRFVLAYHYLVLGRKEEAVGQLREVVRLVPGDQLSAAMLKALTSG